MPENNEQAWERIKQGKYLSSANNLGLTDTSGTFVLSDKERLRSQKRAFPDGM